MFIKALKRNGFKNVVYFLVCQRFTLFYFKIVHFYDKPTVSFTITSTVEILEILICIQ